MVQQFIGKGLWMGCLFLELKMFYEKTLWKSIVQSRAALNGSMLITDCINQHLFLHQITWCFARSTLAHIIQFVVQLQKMFRKKYSSLCWYTFMYDERDDGVFNNLEQIFDFVHVPSFVAPFSGSQNKPCILSRLQKKEKLMKTV